MTTLSSQSRVVFLDWLRFKACFMVMLVHCIEPFYLGGPEGTFIQSRGDAFWVTFLDSALRPAVPLFVLASSYLLFPLKTDTPTFFRRRFVRVLVPLLVWSLLYAVVPMIGQGSIDILGNLKTLPFNFMMHSGHLWFVYMLIGLYLLMPLISPWVEKVSRKEERIFLCLWAFTTLIPVIRYAAAHVTGSPDLWGVCPWNEFGTFYYVSGFIGYLVLGHYFRTHVGELSWKKTLAVAIPFWLIGYAFTAGIFWARIPHGLGYPLSAPYQTAVDMEELSWCFCSFGVMMQTVGYFLILRKFNCSGTFYQRIVQPVSKLSYGMYLMHMFVLVPVFAWVNSWGIPTPAVMLISAAITYVICAVIARLIAFLPKSKYIVG